METEKMTAYKAFDKNLRCKDFQYEIGKTYHHTGEIKICKSGFHSCLNPIDVFNYYHPAYSRYCEVEIWGAMGKNIGDSKVVSEYIFIKKEITIEELNLAYINFLENENKNDIIYGNNFSNTNDKSFIRNINNGEQFNNANSGNNNYNISKGKHSQNANSGNYNYNISYGDYNFNANSGYNNKNINVSNNVQNANSGNYNKNLSIGNYVRNADSGRSNYNISKGNNTNNASSGDYVVNVSNGNNTKNVSCGDYAKIKITGENSMGVAIGINSIIKGIKDTWITLAEYDESGECICIKSAKIDGKKLKENTWYILKNKKFTEIEEDDF